MLPLPASNDNQHPHFHNFQDFPVAHIKNLYNDSLGVNKNLELPLSVRSYAKHTPQPQSFDTTSDNSLQAFHLKCSNHDTRLCQSPS